MNTHQTLPRTGQEPRSRQAGGDSARRQYERFIALAQSESLKGDTVAAENFLQHAEHYLRSMTAAPQPGR